MFVCYFFFVFVSDFCVQFFFDVFFPFISVCFSAVSVDWSKHTYVCVFNCRSKLSDTFTVWYVMNVVKTLADEAKWNDKPTKTIGCPLCVCVCVHLLFFFTRVNFCYVFTVSKYVNVVALISWLYTKPFFVVAFVYLFIYFFWKRCHRLTHTHTKSIHREKNAIRMNWSQQTNK